LRPPNKYCDVVQHNGDSGKPGGLGAGDWGLGDWGLETGDWRLETGEVREQRRNSVGEINTRSESPLRRAERARPIAESP